MHSTQHPNARTTLFYVIPPTGNNPRYKFIISISSDLQYFTMFKIRALHTAQNFVLRRPGLNYAYLTK